MIAGERCRVKRSGELGAVHQVTPYDALVDLDQRTPSGNLISFRHEDVEPCPDPARAPDS